MRREFVGPEKRGGTNKTFDVIARFVGSILVNPFAEKKRAAEQVRLTRLYDQTLRSKIPPLPRGVGEQRGVIPPWHQFAETLTYAQYGQNAQPGDMPTHVLFLTPRDASGRDLAVYSFWRGENGQPYTSQVRVHHVQVGPGPQDFRVVPAPGHQPKPAHPATELEILGMGYQLELTQGWNNLFTNPDAAV